MRLSRRTGAYLLLGVALAAEVGCAGTSRSRELAYVERPVETIYSEATKSLDRHVWEQAAAQFDEVQRQHPYSPWAQRAMNADAVVVTSRHERCAGGGAHGLTHVEVRELDALLGHAVEIGSADLLLPVAAKIAVTEIIRQDENDVRAPIRHPRASQSYS